MVIGIDASRANLEARTGTEWYAFHMIRGLIRNAHQRYQFVLYTKSPLREDWGPMPSSVTVKILRWPPGFFWTQLRLAWEMLWHSPDLLFVPAHTIPLVTPRRTITTLHDVGFEHFSKLYGQQTIGPRWLSPLVRLVTWGRYSSSELDYHRWSARLAIRKALRIITVSEFSKREIIKTLRAVPASIQVIPCGYNMEYHQNNDPEAISGVRMKYGLPKTYFLFIGRIEQKKNIGAMLDAYFRYRSTGGTFDFAFAGSPGYGYEKFKQMIQHSSYESSIHNLGWVPTEDLPLLMNGSGAFIFVTSYEGFGIPVLEAMACGTPVLTAQDHATAEVAGDAALTVPSADPAAIAWGMHEISENQQLREMLKKRGLQHVTKFSWEFSSELLTQCVDDSIKL